MRNHIILNIPRVYNYLKNKLMSVKVWIPGLRDPKLKSCDLEVIHGKQHFMNLNACLPTICNPYAIRNLQLTNVVLKINV